MGFIEKLKLMFKIRQPAIDVINEIKEIKTGFKTWQFWITLLTSLGALAAASQGLLPASVIVIITVAVTLITSLYNLVRGAIKAQVPGQKPFFQTSEFVTSVAACVSTAILSLQSGGINPAVFKTVLSAIAIVMGSLGAGQNLAGQQPNAPASPTK